MAVWEIWGDYGAWQRVRGFCTLLGQDLVKTFLSVLPSIFFYQEDYES